MPLPLLVVLMSAAAAGPAGSSGGADTTPGTTEPDTAVECVHTPADAADPDDSVQPTGTTESATTTAPTPNLAYFGAFCERAEEVARVGPFLAETPTLDTSEQFRAGMCDPEFERPDEHQVTLNWTRYLRRTSQSDRDIGEAWLEAGVLVAFDAHDDGATETDRAVLATLVDIDVSFLDLFAANQTEWCADLSVAVESTEP